MPSIPINVISRLHLLLNRWQWKSPHLTSFANRDSRTLTLLVLEPISTRDPRFIQKSIPLPGFSLICAILLDDQVTPPSKALFQSHSHWTFHHSLFKDFLSASPQHCRQECPHRLPVLSRKTWWSDYSLLSRDLFHHSNSAPFLVIPIAAEDYNWALCCRGLSSSFRILTKEKFHHLQSFGQQHQQCPHHCPGWTCTQVPA